MHLCLLQNLVLKITYLHYFVVMEHIVVLLVDLSPSLVFVFLLAVEFEIMAPSKAISNFFPAYFYFYLGEICGLG